MKQLGKPESNSDVINKHPTTLLKRIGRFKKGFKHTEDFKKWLSEINSGDKHPQFGKHRSEETKKKLKEGSLLHNSRYWLGKHRSEETKEKLRKARINQIMPTKNTKIELIIYKELERRKIKFEKQKRLLDVTIVDAFVSPNICIYADGDYWHSLINVVERDNRINKKLIENGYLVYRFKESEIKEDISKIINFIQL